MKANEENRVSITVRYSSYEDPGRYLVNDGLSSDQTIAGDLRPGPRIRQNVASRIVNAKQSNCRSCMETISTLQMTASI